MLCFVDDELQLAIAEESDRVFLRECARIKGLPKLTYSYELNCSRISVDFPFGAASHAHNRKPAHQLFDVFAKLRGINTDSHIPYVSITKSLKCRLPNP